MDLPLLFLRYAEIFASRGYTLYMIGGTSRDFLLGKEPADYDFVTDATPKEIASFLVAADFAFARFGTVKDVSFGVDVDIATFRKEGGYTDSRHPSFIEFIKDPKEDSNRRDFTINALYIDKDSNILDFHHGLEDLRNGIIRFIGDPQTRIKEDPLRILRAERFVDRLHFQLEEETKKAMEEHYELLRLLNPQKVEMERKKDTNVR